LPPEFDEIQTLCDQRQATHEAVYTGRVFYPSDLYTEKKRKISGKVRFPAEKPSILQDFLSTRHNEKILQYISTLFSK
jgi:hypothetical protein